jgi:hypothetical protein
MAARREHACAPCKSGIEQQLLHRVSPLLARGYPLLSSQRTPKGDARLLCSSTTEVNRAFTEQEVSVAGLRRCVTMRTQGTPPAAATSAGASIRPCWATAVVPARGLPSSRPSRSPSWSSRQTPTRSARVEVSYFTLRLL